MKTFVFRSGAPLFALAVLFGLTGCGSYNRLVTLEQNVNKKWADVQSVYQRRADLIPNLVNTVSGAANFEKSTLTEVTNARASVGRVTLDASKAPTDAAQLQEFQQAQGQLSSALSRLLLVTENYPQLRATENFQNLQAQLEGTENRISVERNNFNAAVQEYNTAMGRFPTNMLNKMFGFQSRPFFTSNPGSDVAPTVNFNAFGASPAPAAPAPPAGRPNVPGSTPPTVDPAPSPALEATP
ncbi:MAG: LemA family protein [Verrucomicrobiota bacterium]|nr:LemA family protein [Verrucomicrobiota bacterium]